MLEKFSLLLGKWKGKGVADFPTIETTEYIEELEFIFTGDGESIQFNQQTWYIDKSRKMKKEMRFILNRDLLLLILTVHLNYLMLRTVSVLKF